jgi:hypothetical protein
MANNLYELILMADIYGSKPTLKIGRLEAFKTRLGSILTITSILCILSALVYFGLDLFSSSNPKIVLSITNIDYPEKYHMSNENFGFVFGLQDVNTYNQYIDETIYTAKAFQKTATRVQVGNSSEFQWDVTPLELVRCSIDKFPDEFKELYKFSPLNDMYCLKNNSFYIDGTFLNDHYSFLYIELSECRNSTEKMDIPCKPKSEIDAKLTGSFFAFSHTDITIDPRNYTSPNQNYNGDTYTTISNKYFKEMHHYVKQIQIETDRGFLLNNVDRIKFLKDDYIKEMTDFRVASNFLSYTLKLSTVFETYSRSYKKVQNVAAEVGGVVEIISILCAVLAFFYNKAKFNELIINEFFYVDDSTGTNMKSIVDNSSNDTKKFNSNTVLHSVMSSNYPSRKESSKQTVVTYSKPTVLIKNSETHNNSKELTIYTPTIRLTFVQSFCYFFASCCFKKSRTTRILEKGQKEVEKQMDILNILKKMGEVDRLKEILLTETQIKLFNLPYKNKLNLDNYVEKDLSKDEIVKYISNLKTNNSHGLNSSVYKTLSHNVYRILNQINLPK